MAKKVGIVSCYFKNNYGSMLQAYATKKILDNNNIPNETINIDNNIDFKNGKKKYYLSQITNFNFIKSKFGMIKLKLDKKIVKNLGKNIKLRNDKYKEFRREFNLSKSVSTYEELGKIAEEKYTDVLVGSDQLWLPVNVVADYYTLNWVPDNINKISYATSFGVSSIPGKYNEKYKKFLNRINHLSIREDSGITLAKEIAGVNGKLVCDPTLLLTKEEWEKEASKEKIYNEKYILCYFLGSNIEHRKFAERLKEKTGLKIVSLNHADEYVKYSDNFCDYAPFDIGPREWIKLVENAEYILTDSFHGTVFSLLFNKKFFCFRRYNAKAKASTNSRLDSILKIAGVSKNRILTGSEDIDEVLKYKIDFEKVNKNLNEFRQESKKWLLESISYKPEKEEVFIEINDKELCSGCTACKNICPKEAIEMVQDEEGFLYPKVNKEKCIKCGKCKKVCPVINRKNIDKIQSGYVLNNKNEEIRKNSTSGGVFTPIAEYILDKKGVVFGACFDEIFKVIHKYVENKKELAIFRGSKYVQSFLGDSFKEVKKFLEDERYVCFSGTPCQIEGLKNYLSKDYEKLVTVDIMCHAVPSPLVLEKYLNYIKKYKLDNENIEKVLFRDKRKYGYKYSTMTVESKSHQYFNGVETDPYLRAFFADLSDRPSCYNCAFKKLYHESDFTIWDCFISEKFEKRLDDDIGTSRILINTSKGKNIFDEIKDKFDYKEVNIKDLTRDVKEMCSSVKYPSKRRVFFENINKKDEKEFFDTYFPNNLRVRLEKYGRIFLVKTGIYKKIKSLAKKILGK